ncbi:hypothetical protein KUTeg_024281 [Tegillarca granosa]|uniref:C-type lectin domain-containing protein n=1 Tax=Tegillarca granosa TaxID=220873 RepID=A0ABQ9E2J8_TEGGR|nr:hypothetical protein KUTeg_024281 [Tegillarca granosa]
MLKIYSQKGHSTMLKYFAVLVLLVVVYTEVESKCPTVCGKGWKFSRITGMCYRLYTYRRTWRQSFYACRNVGAYLVRINNRREFNVVKTFARSFWVNGKRHCYKKRFTFGLSIFTYSRPYVYWARGEPNNKGGNEDCLQIVNRRNNDNRCNRKMYYVCEKAPKFPKY